MLLDRHHRLPDGDHVRLRLPHVGDVEPLAALLARLERPDAEVRLRRAVRAGTAVCATRFDGREETLVGIASGDADTIVAERAPVAALLRDAARERAAGYGPARRSAELP